MHVIIGQNFRLSAVIGVLALAAISNVSNAASVWTGAVSTDWGTAGNWSPATVPTSGKDVDIPTSPSGGRFPVMISGTYDVDKLEIRSGATLTLNGGTIAIHDLVIAAGAAFYQQGGDIHFDHDWKNNGTFVATAGTVQFVGDAGGGGGGFGGTNQFFNVIVNAGVDPKFDKNTGAVIAIAGSFENYNTKLDNTTNATFVFNGSGNQTIYSASTSPTFGNLVVNKPSGAVTLTSDLVVAGDAIVNDGTLDLGPNSLRRKTYGGTFALYGDSVLRVGRDFPSNFANVFIMPPAFVQYGDGVTLTISSANGAFQISGVGTPGRTYRLQSSDDLSTGSWQDISGASLTANGAGWFQFVDTTAAPQRFYRTVYP